MSNILCGIYTIKNIVNNKCYVGFSSNIRRRWGHHRYELRGNRHTNRFLQADWNIYGESSFIFDIIEQCDLARLAERERFYVQLHRANKRKYGYNITEGGEGNFGLVVSKSMRKKLSKKFSGEGNPMYGKNHSQQTKQLLSEQRIGNKNGIGNTNSLAKFRRNNKYFGVVCRKYKKKNGDITIRFRAIFNHYDDITHLGSYIVEEDAARAWDDKCFSVFKDVSLLNFPERYKNNAE